jgi:hypothetical protein
MQKFAYAFILIVSMGTASPALSQAEADTSYSKEDPGTGNPTSATTTFHLPIWTTGDTTTSAQHELLHAIGFSIGYTRFAANVDTNDDNSRDFHDNPANLSTLLAKLTPASLGTHVDPGAGIVDGFDQSQSVMQPTDVAGLRMDGQEKAVLDAAFAWSIKNINIQVIFLGNFTDDQRLVIQSAVAAATSLFGSDSSGLTFTWTVQTDGPSTVVAPFGKQDMASVKTLVEEMKTADPKQMIAATRQILSKGFEALADLKAAGAKPMAGIAPRRIDVLYTLIVGRLEGAIRTTSLGLHVTPGTTRKQIDEMGKRRGFALPEGQRFDASTNPACYVELDRGRDLLQTIQDLVTNEENIVSINFNYVER